MDMLISALIGLAVVVIISIPIGIASRKKWAAQSQAVTDALMNVKDKEEFQETTSVKGEHNDFFYLSVDDIHGKFFFFTGSPDSGYIRRMFSYSDVISASIRFGNEEIVTKKSILGTVGGSLVGSAIAGGVGAIVGGNASSSKSKRKVESISVHILLRNQKESVLDIICHEGILTSGEGLFDHYYQQAQRIMDLMTVAIDKADKAAQQLSTAPSLSSDSSNKSIAQELKELMEMKNQGVLSESEFLKAKEKLLS